MIDTSKGKIFLSAERGHTETEWFRSYNTFNFGNYQSENKNAFGNLYVLNDDTIAAGKKMNFTIEDDSFIILIPVVGAVEFKDGNGHTIMVKAGELITATATAGSNIEFSNPIDEELINYLHLWFKLDAVSNIKSQKINFDIDVNRNRLIKLYQAPIAQNSVSSYIGKFSGREEIVYKLSKTGKGVFVFVLQGAFEVQYRLLESRDGLALWNINEVEIEALSNDAIILLIELPVTKEIAM